MTANYFGKNLAFLRKQRDLSQRTLSAELGINRNRLAAWEEYRSEPSNLDTLMQIANYFTVELQAIVTQDLTLLAACYQFSHVDKSFVQL